MKTAHWIEKTHLFSSDEYICSACGASRKNPYRKCTSCGASMKKAKYDPTWVDEAEGLSVLLDDNW